MAADIATTFGRELEIADRKVRRSEAIGFLQHYHQASEEASLIDCISQLWGFIRDRWS